MRAIRIHRHGGVDVLKIDELPLPTPGPGECLVKIRAVGVNHMDLWVRKGIPGVKIPLPITPGCEAAGVVEGRGDEVVITPGRSCGTCSACREGNDHHCPSYGLYGETEDGVDAEYKVVPERNLIPKPKGISFEEAAAIPVTFLTAWQMLVGRCGLQSGQTVLILAAASGVGSAGIQIAKLSGARVIATVGSEEKIPRAKELGADEVVNHRDPNFSKEVKRLTEGRGVDIVFEHVGAATWENSLKSLAFGGKLVTCGATTGPEVRIWLNHLFAKQQEIIGSTMGPTSALVKILKLAGEKKFAPVIDRIYSFSKAAEAHRRLESREQFGKIVLVPD